MTSAEQTRILAQSDPEYLRASRRERRWVVGLTFVALVAVIGAGFAIAGVVRTEKRVTKVEQSPCTQAEAEPDNPKATRECQKIRAAGERAADAEVNCIPFKRAGYVCPRPGSPLAEERRARRIRKAVSSVEDSSSRDRAIAAAPKRGDATSSPSTGHSQPTPGDGGGSDGGRAPHHGGSHEGAAPGEGGTGGAKAPGESAGTAPSAPPSSSSSQSSSSTTERSERTTEVVHEAAPPPSSTPPAEPETAAAPVREAVGGVVEEAGHVLGETGTTVDEVVGGVGCVVTGALGASCK